jgi:hypothetical protein
MTAINYFTEISTMINSFSRWLLVEGGNVQIGDASADRIDLTNIDRQKIVSILLKGLGAVNSAFQKKTGLPLWEPKLFKSADFLSGSSLHLFDLRGISDEEFAKHKPKVGDIDTQVDGNMKPQLDAFLKSIPKNQTFGTIDYLGYKPSGDQFISLWAIPELGINVQVDLELVDFKDGKPTAWSSFSHSSAWADIQKGIKGVFQKYLLRSIPARNTHEFIVAPKTSRGKEKRISSSVDAFSLKGLRQKYSPVLDETGKQVFKSGIPVYTEIPSKNSNFVTDLDVLFAMFFGKQGSKQDIQNMASFVNLLQLISNNMSRGDQKKIADRFAAILWEKGAQGLTRGDPASDFATKKVAYEILAKSLGGSSVERHQKMIDSYYQAYK